MEGRKLEILKDTTAEPLTECLCPLPVLSRKTRVWVSLVNSANSLWLQRVSDSEILSELLDKLHNVYEEEGKGVEITADVGSLCAAKSENFATWYRARITSINSEENTCDVLFVDYGNTESVPIATNVKSLDTSLFSPHELAMHISLPLTTSEDLTLQLQEITAEKEFMAVFSERNDEIWLADLFEGNMSLSGKLIELGQATLLPGKQIENQIMESNIKLASELPPSLEVLVSHFDSPGQFWLQLGSNIDAVMKFQENIQIIAESLPALDSVQVGLRCIAQFSEDDQWYRAVVLDINSSYTTVRYTDYGNTSQLEITAQGMKQLPKELGSIPDFAFPCCINASPIDGSYWNAEAVARCEELLNQEATITINVVGKEELKIVDIFVDGVSVVDVLLKENLATHRKSPVIECSPNAVPEADMVSSNAEHADFQQSEETIEPSIATDVGDSAKVYEQGLETTVENGMYDEVEEQCESYLENNLAVVSHADSLKEFWLHYQRIAEQLHQLEFRLLEAEFFTPLSDITEGKLCAAIFDEDNLWYRAKILGMVDQGTQVQFIDYGNVSICEDLRKLPADLAKVPPMAQRCSLALPETVTEWPPGAQETFLDLVSDGCKLFEVEVIEQGDPVIVSLTYDGKQIQTEICKDVQEESACTANHSKTEQSVEEENSTMYMIEKEEHEGDEDIKIPESFENEVEVPEGRETALTDNPQKIDDKSGNDAPVKTDVIIDDVQKTEEPDDNECGNYASEKVNETGVFIDDVKKIELDDDKIRNDTPDKIDETSATTVMYLISDDQELENQKEAISDGHISDLDETRAPIDKDGNEEPQTETSCLNGIKENGELPAVDENIMDENGAEIEKQGILVAEDKQYIGVNDSTALIEGSKINAVSADGNLVTDEKLKGTKELSEKESDSHEVNALNIPEHPVEKGENHNNGTAEKPKGTKELSEKESDSHEVNALNIPKHPVVKGENHNNGTAEKPKGTKELSEKESDSHEMNTLTIPEHPVEKAENHNSGVCTTLKSSECKIEHTEELVRKINVEMMVMDKEAKKSQMDRVISVSASKEPASTLPESDNTGPSSLPEELPRFQSENGATKSEPSTPLLSRAERLSVKDEKQERSLSSPRLNHNERIVPGCISRGESLDSVDETISVTVVHDTEKIVPDTIEDVIHCSERIE